MSARVKCYSVRLQSLTSISEKCYKAVDFNGNEALIPKSQVFGQDWEVSKCDAYWISDWILSQKEITYSKSKSSFFDKGKAEYQHKEGIEVTRHIPEKIEPIEPTIDNELLK